MRKRINRRSFDGMLADFDEHELTKAVGCVITDELVETPVFQMRDEAFRYRFTTTKSGSHSSVGSTLAGNAADPLPGRELTRRNFVEALRENVIARTPCGAWISRSDKLEHGKSRALFACDSMNYLAFDSPCRSVERAWLGRCLALTPPKGTTGEDYEKRAARLLRHKLMFDYADFNSAHTLTAQKVVLKRLFRGLHDDWHRWLVKSFDNKSPECASYISRHFWHI